MRKRLGRLLSVTNALEAGTWRQGERLGHRLGALGGGGGSPPSNASLNPAPAWREIYNRENVVGPFLVHQVLGPKPPPPLPPSPPPAQKKPWRGLAGGVLACRLWCVVLICSWLAPNGQSPFAALPLDPLPPQAAVPIGLSPPCVLPLPPRPNLPSPFPFPFPWPFPP